MTHPAPSRTILFQDDGPMPSVTLPSDLASRLHGAKPVTWRGKGDLAQVPWTAPPRGAWLVLDLWAGYSGLCLALLQLGMHFYAVAAECEVDARSVAHNNMPNIVHVDRVEALTAQAFRPFLQRRSVRGVLMGGGSPCQGNSSLNMSRKGLEDPRSRQPLELRRLRDEFLALPEMADRELVTFLENVGSMPRDVQASYTAWLGGDPILIDAATCGWVQRRRLYWLVSAKRSIAPDLAPPSCWDWVPREGGVPTLAYVGDKPLPNKCFFHQGFGPLLDPKAVVKSGGDGAMHPFTREFFHPTDRTSSSSAAAVSRFLEDDRRFPPSAYEERSLLWKDSQWRQLLPAERAQMMGVPPGSFDTVPGDAPLKRQRQNSLLGNGFHLFSVLAVLCFLPQVLEAKLVQSITPWEERLLHERLNNTIWEPGRLQHFPSLVTADDVVHDLPGLFPHCVIAPGVLEDTRRRLAHCDLTMLQGYMAWCKLRGLSVDDLGPQPLTRMDRARVYSGLTGQRHPADSSKGLDHLLAPGLGMEGHMTASSSLPSPFQPVDWPEMDVMFVVDAICTWRQFLPAYARRLRQVLKSVALALHPLEEALALWRSESARKVAAAKRPGFIAAMTILLRWPDLMQGQNLVSGYPIVGEIEPSGLFRPILAKDVASLDEWLANAGQIVDDLMVSRPPKHAADILEQTLAEQRKGFCSPLQTREALDRRFGVSGWRPLERFQIVQADNKKRMIDNGRRTQHNAHTSMQETIFTVSIDFVAAVAAALCKRLAVQTSPGALQFPSWLRLRLGTDDLPDAYRGLPVCDQHQRYSIVAIFVPDCGWRFTVLWGLAFGLESAVVSFNRFPQLGIAIARRCVLTMEAVADMDVSQLGLRLVFNLMGAPPQPEKGFRPAADRHYLGTSVHTGDMIDRGVIRVQPKATTINKVLTKLEAALSTGQLSRDDAGKLRGDVTWLFTMCCGHLGKLAGPALTAHQFGDSAHLLPSERRQLEVLRLAVLTSKPRDIPVHPQCAQVTRVYSDASFEDGILRLGWIIFPPASMPVGGTCVVPPSVIARWKPRTQQIYPGETLAAVVVPALCPTSLRNADILWFFDNEAAVSALIRATTAEPDVLILVQQAHLQFHDLQMRTWIEWVDSASNPADGLSRLGLADPWTAAQPWRVQEFSFPPLSDPDVFLAQLAAPIGGVNSG